MLSSEHMQSLPHFFEDIPDPRRPQGRRHCLPTVLAIAAAVLCGMRGYEAIWEWANDLSQQARSRFRYRYRDKRYHDSRTPDQANPLQPNTKLEQIYRGRSWGSIASGTTLW